MHPKRNGRLQPLESNAPDRQVKEYLSGRSVGRAAQAPHAPEKRWADNDNDQPPDSGQLDYSQPASGIQLARPAIKP